MHLARRLLLLLALPALALAQDTAPPDPAGTVLFDALPPGADLVVHAPSLPRFLASAVEAGFGTRDAWHGAFRKQLTLWGGNGGDPDRLVAAGEALLALADGETIAASIELPRLGSPTAPRTRCALFAFRSRAKEQVLRAQVNEIVAAGLRIRYPGEPRVEKTMGQTVLALTATYDGLWIGVQDHLVAAADHPLALGLFFRGLERVAREKKEPEDVAAVPLRVRYGRADAPNRWTGLTFLQREAVTAPYDAAPPTSPLAADGGAVLSWVTSDVRDVPVFPVRLPEEFAAKPEPPQGTTPTETPSEKPAESAATPAPAKIVRLRADGTWDVAEVPPDTAGAAAGTPRPADAQPMVGAAARLGWLRAMAEGKLPIPVAAIDPEVLADVVASAATTQPKDAVPVCEWRPAEDVGQLRGPAWHGPVTFLALRVLRDIAHGFAPDAPPPPPAEPPSKPVGPMAPPSPRPPRAPGDAPDKPDAPLPVPKDKPR